MKPYSFRYSFTQHFDAPADKAFEWCTDYDSGDLALMGEKGVRTVERVSWDTILLTESYSEGKGKVRKLKLVRLDPEKLSWTNTQLEGPNVHSQFIYQIVPHGASSSSLEFTGFQVNYDDRGKDDDAIEKIALKARDEDVEAWKKLATAMHVELMTPVSEPRPRPTVKPAPKPRPKPAPKKVRPKRRARRSPRSS